MVSDQLKAYLEKFKREVALIPLGGSDADAIDAYRDVTTTSGMLTFWILTDYASEQRQLYPDRDTPEM